jgi:PAS domain S-box-containing protein
VKPDANTRGGVSGYSLLAYGFLGLFVLAVLGAVVTTAYRDRASQLELQLQRAKGNALIFEDQISQTLQLIENTVRTLPEVSDLALDRSPPEDLSRLLKRMQFSQAAVRSLSVMTEAEGVRASSNPANVGQYLDLQDFRPGDRGDAETSVLRIGPAWQGRDLADGRPSYAAMPVEADQAYFIPMALRLGNKANAVWVVVALNPDYLLDRQSRYIQADTDQFQMARLDGAVLVSTQSSAVGTAFAQPALLSRIQAVEVGTSEDEQLTAFRTSMRYPFFITVDVGRNAILADWKRKTTLTLASTLAALMAVVLITLLLMRRIRANEDAERLQQGTIRKLSQAMEQSPTGILIMNAEGLVEYCNPFFCTLSGYTAADMLGKQPYFLDAGYTAPETFKTLQTTLVAGQIWSGEFVQRHRDGHEFTVSAVMAPLRDDTGRITHYISSEHDISAQKTLQRDLEVARDKAESATRAKSEFLANMSHEIRTPMNGVIGMTGLALDTDLDSKQRHYLNTVKSSAESLLVILNDILDFSKIEAGKLEIERIPFDLSKLMDDVGIAMEFRTSKKGLTLACDLAPDLPAMVVGDAGRIRQVLVNLFDNALKFTRQGGITLRAQVGARKAGECELHWSVSDTGVGIAPEKQKLIFAAFAQADASTTRQYGGTGLGLAICARLVELMGGRIWVESNLGQGSTFHFTVRLGQVLASAAALPRPAVALPGSGSGPLAGAKPNAAHVNRPLLVMLVEDNAINQLVATSLLNKWGHTVVLAENGQESLDLYPTRAWDAILMDMQMPVMGGLEATAGIRSVEPADHHVPIIAITANAMDTDREACLAAGMDDFLAKPLNAADLQTMLEHYCPTLQNSQEF